jgi:2-phosphosulfolactate phosphatase
MKIRFFATLEQAERDVLHGVCLVVIDVLRASSTIITALENGAERIIPTPDVETASRLVRPAERDKKLLAGERKCCPVPGFDLCNSPQDFAPERVGGKTIVFTTSNGTRGILLGAKARRIVVGALINVHAVGEALRREGDIAVLCCGTEGALAAEDLLCGGMLLRSLGEGGGVEPLNDAARVSLAIAERFGGDAEHFVRSTDHGRRLIALGFERDVVFCSRVGATGVVPEVRGGEITK